MIKVVSRKLYFFSAILFFLCALYSLAGRYVVAKMPSYKPVLEQWLSQQFNAPVKIGQLEAHWEILNPSLYVSHIYISDQKNQKDSPRLQKIKLRMNLLSSLWYRDLRLRGVEIQGLEITLEKTATGKIHLVGIPISSVPFELSRWIDSLLSQGHVLLKDVLVHYRTAEQAYELNSTQIRLGKKGADYQLLAALKIRKQSSMQFLSIPHLSASLHWNSLDPQNWRVLLNSITLKNAYHKLENQKIFIEHKKETSGKRPISNWHIQVSRLPIVWLLDAVPFISFLTEDQKTLLKVLKPKGELTDVNVVLTRDAVNVFTLINFSSHFSQLSSQAYKKIPGFSGLDGFLSGNNQKGVMNVNSENFMLDLADIFRWPISAQGLSVNLRWFTDNKKQLQLESGLLNVLANGAQGRGLLSLVFPEKEPALLRLNASVWNGDARDTPKYLPTKSMSQGLVDWLDTAILAGHLVEGNFLFNGSIAPESSLENKQHTFQMRYQVEQAEINYFPHWPRLSSANVDALILGREAEIQLKKGRIEKSSDAVGLITVPYFSSTDIPRLRVSAQILSNAEDGVQVLKTSPLKHSLSPVVNSLTGQGPLSVKLNLNIPLEASSHHFVEQKIDVDVGLNGVNLNLIGSGFSAQKVQGEIFYREKTGLQSKKLAGFLLDKPVVAEIHTSLEKNNSQTKVKISGVAGVAELQKWQPNPVWSFLKGETSFQAVLTMNSISKNNSGITALEISSDLMGMAINLPKPLAKLAEEEKTFGYRMNLFENNQSIQFELGKEIKANLLKNAKGDLQGQISVGRSVINRSFKKQGISVVGDLDELDVKPWYELIKEAEKLPFVSRYSSARYWPQLDIQLNALKSGKEEWGSWHVQTQPMKDGVQINLIEGKIKELQIQGQGFWSQMNHGSTHFKGTVEAQDIYKVMHAWGYTPSATSEKVRTTIDMSWPGSPFEPDLKKITGKFDVLVSKGKLISLEGASSIKAISLFNIQNLQRRLELDFSDLFKKGVSYDSMQGHFDLGQGLLSTPQFSITGPSIKFLLSGDADLEKHLLNQQLDLTLPAARNLVIPAAVIGGIPAAATVYAIDKVLGSSLDKLTTFHFKLQGDWDKPTVTQHFFKESP